MKSSSARLAPFLPPLVWTAFLWLYVVIASDVEFQPFYILIRGRGAVIYPTAITLFSRSADLDVFLVVSAALLLGHFLLFGKDSVRDPWALLASLAFAVSLAGFAITTSVLLIALLGLTSIILVAVGARKASDATGVAAGRILGYSALCAVAVLATLALASAARWVIGGIDGSTPLAGWSWQPAYISLQLLGSLFQFFPNLRSSSSSRGRFALLSRRFCTVTVRG